LPESGCGDASGFAAGRRLGGFRFVLCDAFVSVARAKVCGRVRAGVFGSLAVGLNSHCRRRGPGRYEVFEGKVNTLEGSPIFNADPRGRLDVAAVRLGEMFVRNTVEPAVGLKLWDNGADELCAAYVEALGVPSQPVTIADLFRAAGWLPSRRRAR
jgi:hypothetical protein